MTPEECNLEFICIYCQGHPPGSPIRTFVDDWFAFHTRGPFLNKNGRPIWFNRPSPTKYKEALLSMHFVSEKAAEVIENGGGEDLIKDHTVPVLVLRKLIDELKHPNRADVKQFLLKHYRVGVLTKSDNQLLKSAGLNSKMPKDWDGGDMFARYEFVNIKGRTNSLA